MQEDPYLPREILWRQKEQFSDGVGYSWIDGLSAHCASKITDQEFLELSQHFSDCAQQQNVEVTVDSQGGMSTSYPSGMSEADGDAIVKQCDADNDFTDMNMLRGDMSSNPNNEDPVVPLLKCLKQYGLAEQSMTVEDYKAIVSDESKDRDVFGKYFDESVPGYDAAKAKQYIACQTEA